MNSTEFNSSASVRPKELSGIHEETVPNNTRWEEGVNKTLPNLQVVDHQQGSHHRHILKLLPPMEATGGEKSSTPIKGIKRGHPRQNPHKHFDINEHLPWMIVLFLLLVLVVIVVCSIRKSSRTLKKGPRQDPSAIVEKAGLKKSIAPTHNREKWIYYCNGHGELSFLLLASFSLVSVVWRSGKCNVSGMSFVHLVLFDLDVLGEMRWSAFDALCSERITALPFSPRAHLKGHVAK